MALRIAVNYEAGTVETTHTLSKVISLRSFFPQCCFMDFINGSGQLFKIHKSNSVVCSEDDV